MKLKQRIRYLEATKEKDSDYTQIGVLDEQHAGSRLDHRGETIEVTYADWDAKPIVLVPTMHLALFKHPLLLLMKTSLIFMLHNYNNELDLKMNRLRVESIQRRSKP